jgi:hypothetical protein
MSLKRELSTQERVDLAVKAGHWAAVTDFVRMHDGQGLTGAETGNGVISVAEPSGTPKVYSSLPGYAFAAIDCYLTSLGVVQYTTRERAKDIVPKPSMLTMAYFNYANHCHEQAAYFESQVGLTYSGRLKQDSEFAASHIAFSIIEESIKTHPFDVHGNKLFADATHETHVIQLANGRKVCRGTGEADRNGQRGYVFYKHDDCKTHLSVEDILNHEMNELAETLREKGLGLQ